MITQAVSVDREEVVQILSLGTLRIRDKVNEEKPATEVEESSVK